jgi:hypothetical protein
MQHICHAHPFLFALVQFGGLSFATGGISAMIKIVNSCSDKPVDVKVKIDKEAKVADLICSLQEITSLSIEGIEVAVGRSRTTVNLSAIKSDEILSTYVKSGDIVYVSKKEEVVLKRKIVPADNSCLFHSLQYLLQESRDLRSIVAVSENFNPRCCIPL